MSSTTFEALVKNLSIGSPLSQNDESAYPRTELAINSPRIASQVQKILHHILTHQNEFKNHIDYFFGSEASSIDIATRGIHNLMGGKTMKIRGKVASSSTISAFNYVPPSLSHGYAPSDDFENAYLVAKLLLELCVTNSIYQLVITGVSPILWFRKWYLDHENIIKSNLITLHVKTLEVNDHFFKANPSIHNTLETVQRERKWVYMHWDDTFIEFHYGVTENDGYEYATQEELLPQSTFSPYYSFNASYKLVKTEPIQCDTPKRWTFQSDDENMDDLLRHVETGGFDISRSNWPLHDLRGYAKVFFVCGLPGSGKTHFVNRIRKDCHYDTLSGDDFGEKIGQSWIVDAIALKNAILQDYTSGRVYIDIHCDNLANVIHVIEPSGILFVWPSIDRLRSSYAERGTDPNNLFSRHFKLMSGYSDERIGEMIENYYHYLYDMEWPLVMLGSTERPIRSDPSGKDVESIEYYDKQFGQNMKGKRATAYPFPVPTTPQEPGCSRLVGNLPQHVPEGASRIAASRLLRDCIIPFKDHRHFPHGGAYINTLSWLNKFELLALLEKLKKQDPAAAQTAVIFTLPILKSDYNDRIELKEIMPQILKDYMVIPLRTFLAEFGFKFTFGHPALRHAIFFSEEFHPHLLRIFTRHTIYTTPSPRIPEVRRLIAIHNPDYHQIYWNIRNERSLALGKHFVTRKNIASYIGIEAPLRFSPSGHLFLFEYYLQFSDRFPEGLLPPDPRLVLAYYLAVVVAKGPALIRQTKTNDYGITTTKRVEQHIKYCKRLLEKMTGRAKLTIGTFDTPLGNKVHHTAQECFVGSLMAVENAHRFGFDPKECIGYHQWFKDIDSPLYTIENIHPEDPDDVIQ